MSNNKLRSIGLRGRLCMAFLLAAGLETGFASSALADIYFNNFTSKATVAANPACTSPGNEGIVKLTDNLIKTSKWLVQNSLTATPYATFSFDEPQQLDAYTLVTGNDSESTRQPTAWTIYGSNDNGQSWTIVDQHTGFAQQAANSSSLFYVNSAAADTNAYTQYKLNIDSWTNHSQNLIQISEFQMFSLQQGNRIGAGTNTLTATNNEGAVAPVSTKEAIFFANDDNINTKFCTKTEPSSANPIVVTYTFNSAQEVAAYSLTSANDYPGRTPSQWTLSGSNDGTTWTDLSTVNSFIGTTYFPLGESLTSADPYSQYKVTITQTAKSLNAAGDGFQFSELAFYDNSTIESKQIDLTKIANQKFAYTSSPSVTWGDGAAANAFDHKSTTKWGVDNPTPSMEFSLGSAFAMNSYTITAVNEATNLGRNPKAWTLYGKAEDGSWVALDSRENVAFYSGTDYTTLKKQTFTFDNTTKYQDYKLDITSNNGHATQFQLADFELFDSMSVLAPTENPLLALTQHPAISITGSAVGGWGNTKYIEGDDTTRIDSTLLHAFDGRSQTKLCITYTNISPDDPYAITFNFKDGLEFVLDGYTITTGDDEAGRDPASWAIYGSPDGSRWYCLDEVALTADTIYGTERKADQLFLLNNDNAYNYYRFSFMETRDASLSVFQMSELTLYGYAGVNYEVPEPSTYAMILLGIGGLFWLRRKR